ncbi:MAG: patatin family protein [Oscillospiraceae bacterium]|nr:patatin family protein [Oscillospiraceae bacterium]
MKTGLVLEGGALRTIFSSGVCDALLEGGVGVDYVVGVSAGIAYGVSYVSRQPRRNLELVTRYAADRRYMGVGNLLNPRNRSYFGLDFTFRRIPEELLPFDYDTFAAYPGEMEAVVTDLATGQAHYLPVPRDAAGSSLVLQASCALPLMFPIYRLDGSDYLDGGVADAIPYERALALGCDRVVVVLTRPRDFMRKPDTALKLVEWKYRKYPAFCAAMRSRARRYNECRKRLFEKERQGEILVIAPENTRGVSRTERDGEKLRLLWSDGYKMGMERLDELRAYLRG